MRFPTALKTTVTNKLFFIVYNRHTSAMKRIKQKSLSQGNYYCSVYFISVLNFVFKNGVNRSQTKV